VAASQALAASPVRLLPSLPFRPPRPRSCFLKPELRPCIGKTQATISASVFPGERRRDALIRNGMPFNVAKKVTNSLGVVVRYTIDADGYRHRPLAVAYTLFSVGRDGTLGPVVGTDRVPDRIFEPAACSDQGGYDAFIAVPHAHRRYRILLELFRDTKLRERVSLLETAPFRD
jgi:hypothetical protein